MSILILIVAWLVAISEVTIASHWSYWSIYFLLINLSSFFVILVYLRLPDVWSTADVVKRREALVALRSKKLAPAPHDADPLDPEGMDRAFHSSSVELMGVRQGRRASGQ